MASPDDPHWRAGAIDSARFDLLYAVIDKGPDIPVLEYLQSGGDPNLRSREFGWTLLHAAAFKGRRALVAALVAAGADLDALTHQGFTPLAYAAHKGHLGCVKVLLAAGASLNCEPLGRPLVESLQYASVKSEEMVALLLAASAEAQR